MTQITFHSIINTALLKANNRDNLKSYIIRQSKIANRDAFYTLEDFSQGLIEVATGKMNLIKHLHAEYLKEEQSNIDNIDSKTFELPPSEKSYSEYTSEELKLLQDSLRERYLEQTRKDLEQSKINDYHNNEYGRLENIIEVVNEINNKNNNATDNPDSEVSKHKKQGRPKAVIQDASHYLSNEKLLPFLKSKYSEIKPQVFNHLIRVLIDLNQLKTATKKEYKEAFGEALNVKQSQTNFDNSFILNPNTTIYTPIKIEISNFLGSIEI